MLLRRDAKFLDKVTNRYERVFSPVGRTVFEKQEGNPLTDYSAKIRDMLEEHLHVTGLAVTCKARNVTDPMFWEDFEFEGKSAQDLREAAIRKNMELTKIAREKVAENPLRYASFSERVREVIERFQQGQIDIAELLREQEKLMKAFMDEESAHERTKLSAEAYGVYRILQAFQPPKEPAAAAADSGGETYATQEDKDSGLSGLERVAHEIHEVYASDASAPVGWHPAGRRHRDPVSHPAFRCGTAQADRRDAGRCGGRRPGGSGRGRDRGFHA
jgi:type I restriction enzyme R subunit